MEDTCENERTTIVISLKTPADPVVVNECVRWIWPSSGLYDLTPLTEPIRICTENQTKDKKGLLLAHLLFNFHDTDCAGDPIGEDPDLKEIE